MIAQKMMDAKHSQEPGHPPIAGADLVATTPWTSSSKHPGSLLVYENPLKVTGQKAAALIPRLPGVGAIRVDRASPGSQARS
jgi:hypothetical protein